MQQKYRHVRTIAIGGMGTVSAVYDLNLLRPVAMKVLNDHADKSADFVRFIAEAQVCGQLEHPNIMPVHDLAVDQQGRCFFTMKLVHGRTLKDIIRKIIDGDAGTIADWPLAELLKVFQKACDAVAFAHHKGVVHSDLKPENIMVDSSGEVFVADWGLARIIPGSETHELLEDLPESALLETPVSSVLSEHPELLDEPPDAIHGTPQFMPLEQAMADPLDGRSDIYALGGIIYNILTLRYAIAADSMGVWICNLRAGNVKAPELYNESDENPDKNLPHCPGRRIPSSLAAVAMKALEQKRVNRYQTVRELQKDIQAYQMGFATVAEEAGWWRKSFLFLARHRQGALMFLLLLTGLMIFLGNLRYKQIRETEALARWGEPILAEDFQDESWRERWEVRDGEFKQENGRLVTVAGAGYIFRLVYNKDITGPCAIEFDGECLEGYAPGDLSAIWMSGTNLNQVLYLQTGAWYNQFARIQRTGIQARQQLDYNPFKLEVGRKYRIRAEIDNYNFSLFVDGKKICDFTDVFPEKAGRIGIYGYFPGKAFSNIRIYTRETPLRVSVIEIGDMLFRAEMYKDAAQEYERIWNSHRHTALGYRALFKAGLSLEALGDVDAALAVWQGLRGTPQDAPARLQLLKHLHLQGDTDAYLAGFRQLWYDADQRFHKQMGAQWELFASALSEDNFPLLERYYELGERLLGNQERHQTTLADLLLQMRRFEEILEKYPDEPNYAPQAMLELGLEEEMLERFPERTHSVIQALTRLGRFEEIIRRYPENQEAVALALLRLGRGAEVLDRYPASRRICAQTLLNLGRGREVLEEFPELRRENAVALMHLGRFEEILNEYPEQTELYIQALRNLGRHDQILEMFPEHHAERAAAMVELGRFTAAVALYPGELRRLYLRNHQSPELETTVLELFPDDDQVKIRSLINRGAIEELRRLYPNARERHAECLLHAGRYEDIISDYPDLRQYYAAALAETGNRKVLMSRFADQDEACARALLREGRQQELLLKYPDLRQICALSWLYRGRYQQVFRFYPDIRPVSARAGLLQEMDKWLKDQAREPLRLYVLLQEAGDPELRLILLPFLRWLQEPQRKTMPEYAQLLQESAAQRHQPFWQAAAFLTGKINEGLFRAQPLRRRVEARLYLYAAMRAELRQRPEAALKAYANLQKLALADRQETAPEAFVRWRIQALTQKP